jgi:glycosyltransferase involved in cell wall biosynthesis
VRRIPNVRWLGYVPQEEVAGLLEAAAVGIIPFSRNALTAAINPNKLYEYLAAGRPVVSVDFSAEAAAPGELVYLAQDQDSFAEQIGRAIAEDDATARTRRQAFAAQHDWKDKAREFATVLASAAG